ncbi:MAG: hypothetical protein JSV44_07380, partial [Candidatus Zixiibacteriota bacterium]
MERAKATFSSLIKTLAIPVPIFSSITIALIASADRMEILSFTLSANHAAFFCVILLLAVYLQCYRAARVLLQNMDTKDGFIETVTLLRSHSSIFNPFLCTVRKNDIKRPFSDYLGIIVNNISPIAIAVVFGIVL